MPLPDLSTLPPWAIVVLAVCVAIILVVGRLGWFQGQKSPAGQASEGATVAAVIVDSTALNRATAAIEAMNFTLTETNAIGKNLIVSNEKLAQAKIVAAEKAEDLAEEVGKHRTEMQIGREVNRR